jgi:cell division protein FtsZ
MEDPVLASDGDSAAPAEMAEAVESASPPASPVKDFTDATEPGDAFIPPDPADPSVPDETAAPDPFAAAAMANGATELEGGATRKSTKGSGLSLFERVTGTGRATKAAKTEEETSVVNIEAPEPAPESILAADETEQTQLGGMNPTDRLTASKAEEDLLDIPAFLRRQAN